MRRIIENDQDRQHPLLTVFEQNRKHDRFIQYQKVGYMVSRDVFDLSEMGVYVSRSEFND